jgi:hypothetical protein
VVTSIANKLKLKRDSGRWVVSYYPTTDCGYTTTYFASQYYTTSALTWIAACTNVFTTVQAPTPVIWTTVDTYLPVTELSTTVTWTTITPDPVTTTTFLPPNTPAPNPASSSSSLDDQPPASSNTPDNQPPASSNTPDNQPTTSSGNAPDQSISGDGAPVIVTIATVITVSGTATPVKATITGFRGSNGVAVGTVTLPNGVVIVSTDVTITTGKGATVTGAQGSHAVREFESGFRGLILSSLVAAATVAGVFLVWA